MIRTANNQLTSKVTIEIKRGDLLQMEFGDETFDLVRSDITFLHLDMVKTLTEVRHVLLKVNGRLVALEVDAENM